MTYRGGGGRGPRAVRGDQLCGGGGRGAPTGGRGGGGGRFVWTPPRHAALAPYTPAVAVDHNPNATGPHQGAYLLVVVVRGSTPTTAYPYSAAVRAPSPTPTAAPFQPDRLSLPGPGTGTPSPGAVGKELEQQQLFVTETVRGPPAAAEAAANVAKEVKQKAAFVTDIALAPRAAAAAAAVAKEDKQKAFVTDIALTPRAATAAAAVAALQVGQPKEEKAPEVDLAPVPEKGLAHPARPGAGTIGMHAMIPVKLFLNNADNNDKMINGGIIDDWECLGFSCMSPEEVYRFTVDLIQMCNATGMSVAPRLLLDILSSSPNQIENGKRHHARLFPEVHGKHELTDKIVDILPETVCRSFLSTRMIGTSKIQIKKALRGVCVETNHQKYEIRRFPVDERETGMIILQYFKGRYNYNLHYTTWPCLQSGSDSQPIYLLVEECKLVELQTYFKLNDMQIKNIVTVTCQSPQQREQIFHEVVASMDWPEITKHGNMMIIEVHFGVGKDPRRGTVVGGMIKQPDRELTTSLSSSSSSHQIIGTSKIQVIVKIDNFGSIAMPFEDNCTIQQIVSAAFCRKSIYLPDAVIRVNGRNAYLDDRLCSLNTNRDKECSLYIRPRLRGGQPPSSSISPARQLFELYVSLLGDKLFDVVTFPSDQALQFDGMEKYFMSLGFSGIEIAIMLFELLETSHDRPECVSRFTLADIDYDSTSKRLVFRGSVGPVAFDLPTYYQNMADAGGVVKAIFRFDELKVLANRPGIYLPPGNVGNNYSKLPKFVQLLVYDLETGVRQFPDAGTSKRRRAYFRRHAAVMTPAERLSFWVSSELYFDYLGGPKKMDAYLAQVKIPDWSPLALLSVAMMKTYQWQSFNKYSLGAQWSCSRNWLAHAPSKLTLKISEKQAEAYLNIIFPWLFYYVLLKITFPRVKISWNTRPLPAVQPPPLPPHFGQRCHRGPPLRVNNRFTLHQLLDTSGSLNF